MPICRNLLAIGAYQIGRT